MSDQSYNRAAHIVTNVISKVIEVCKNLRQIRGDVSEAARIGGSAPIINQVGTTTSRFSSTAPNPSATPRTSHVEKLDGSNLSS